MNLVLTLKELFGLKPVITVSNNILYGGPNGVGMCNEILFNSCSLVIKLPCIICTLRNVNNQRALLNVDEATEIGLTKLVSIIHNIFGVELVPLVTKQSKKRPRVLSPKLTIADTKYDTNVFIGDLELDVSNWPTIQGETGISYIRFVGLYKTNKSSSIVIELLRLFINSDIIISSQIIDPDNISIIPTETMSRNTLYDSMFVDQEYGDFIEQISVTRLVAVNNCICHIVDGSGQETVENFQIRDMNMEPDGYVYLLLRINGNVDVGILSKQTDLKQWYIENIGSLVRLLYPISNISITEKVYIGILEKKYEMRHIELCSMIHDFIKIYSVL